MFRSEAKVDFMKQILFKLAFILVWMLVKQAFSLPQLPSADRSTSQGAQDDRGRLEVLTDALALTKHQQEQVKSILDGQEECTRTLVKQLNESSESLRAVEKAGADNSRIDTAAADVTIISGRLLAADARAESEIYALLSDEQRR